MGKSQDRAAERIALVGAVIRAWDPYGLFEGGCPEDEFDSEIRAVCRQLPRIHSAHDAAHVVSRVFQSSFDDAARFAPDACKQVGEDLYRALCEGGAIG